MKMYPPVLASAFLLFSFACGHSTDSYIAPQPQAAIAIEPLETTANSPQWDSAKVVITTADGKEFLKADFMRDDDKLSEGPEFDVKVPYGSYQVKLEYYDKDKKLVYVSCNESAAQQHKIEKPSYDLNPTICEAGSENSSNESKVVIKPVLDEDEDPTPTIPTNKVDGSWSRCANYSDSSSVLHTYTVDTIKKTLSWGTVRYKEANCKDGTADPVAMMPSFNATISEITGESPLYIKYKRSNNAIESVEFRVEGDKLTSEMDCFYNADGSKRGCNDVLSVFNRIKPAAAQ